MTFSDILSDVPPCLTCSVAIDFENGDQWVWLEGEDEPALTVCRRCLEASVAANQLRAPAGWRGGSLAPGSFLFHLVQCEPVDGGLKEIVLVASNERTAIFLATRHCRNDEDVRAWLTGGDVFIYPLGPAFVASIEPDGAVLAVYNTAAEREWETR